MLSTLLLSVLSWSSAAWAGDGATAAPSAPAVEAPRTLTSPLQVAAYINELRLVVNRPLLLAPDGDGAEKVATTVASAMPPGTVRVKRAGSVAEVAKALVDAGLTCAVRLSAPTDTTFTAEKLGDCSPAPAPVVAAPPAAPAPTVASSPPPVTTTPVATTPPAAAPAPTVGETKTLASPLQVAAYINEVRLTANSPVLLAAAGPDAERVAQKVAEAMPSGQVRVARVGYIGDSTDEVKLALTSAGMRCAVRLGTTTATTFTVARFGDCSPGGSAPVAAPPVAGAPAPSAASIPGATAALGGSPTPASTQPAPIAVVTAPAGPPPPPPPPDPKVLEATYDLVALRRVPNPNPREDAPEADWAIRDGRGRYLTAPEFAKRAGDAPTQARLERDQKTSKAVSATLAVTGGGLTIAGLGVLLARDAGAPDWSDFEVNATNYDTNEAYFEALGQAEADYKAAQRAHNIQRDDRVWIAGFLTGSGLLAVGTSAFAGRGLADRQKQTALYWTPDQADALLRAHNASVRQNLGLPPELAPTKVVIQAPPPPAPDDEEEEDSEDPPEDAPKADPAGPSGAVLPSSHPELALHPVVGVAWLGLAGTF